MNPLDIILSASILTAGLFGKYSGFNIQFNKLLSILLSILITKVIFIELIIFFIPYIGLSTQTKPIVYFMSIAIIYFILRFVFNFGVKLLVVILTFLGGWWVGNSDKLCLLYTSDAADE